MRACHKLLLNANSNQNSLWIFTCHSYVSQIAGSSYLYLNKLIPVSLSFISPRASVLIPHSIISYLIIIGKPRILL